MERSEGKIEVWLDNHPLFTRIYVPLVVTVTLIVALVNAFTQGGR